MSDGDVSAASYLAQARAAIDKVAESQLGAVSDAADMIVEALRNDGIVQAFGTGHSQATAMEIAGRAGGLIPTNRISLRDLVFYGDEPKESLSGPLIERDPTLGQRLYDITPVRPADVFVVISNSGINGSVVGMAETVKSHGHGLIAITSLQHSSLVESRHPSGRKLVDLADVVLDNGGPFGDAVLPLPGGGAVGAVSSITAALLAQLVTAEVIRRLLEAGEEPPVYLSANVPKGDEHNEILLNRYEGRIRRGV